MARSLADGKGDELTIPGAVGAAVVLTLFNPALPLGEIVAGPSPPLVGTPTAGVVTSAAVAASPVLISAPWTMGQPTVSALKYRAPPNIHPP